MALDFLLAEAKAARLNDDFDAALRLIRAYLEQAPNSQEGESFLGLCLVETGNIGGGKPLIEKAAIAAPNNPQFRLNLSILREIEGDARAAVTEANKAAELAPGRIEAWGHLGNLLGKYGKFAEAAAALEQAHKIAPDHSGVLTLLIGAYFEIGEFDKAQSSLAKLEALTGESEQSLQFKAHLARQRAQWSDLVAIAERWLAANPLNEEARVAIAYGQAQQGYYRAAMAAYAPLVQMRKPKADHLAAMGRYALGARDLPIAEDYFQKAIRQQNTCAEALFGMARLKTYQGDFDAAQDFCRRAISADPTHAEAYGQLCEITGGQLNDNELNAIDRLSADGRLTPEQLAILHFAKGDTFHRRKEHEKAFAAWSQANAIKNEQLAALNLEYRPDDNIMRNKKIMALFSNLAEQPIAPIDGEPTPIFIVGMPRSGTTLLENAIAAHPDVDGAGEVPAMPFILSQALEWAEDAGWNGGDLPSDLANEWRGSYLRQARQYGAGGAPFFTDKQPSNFLSVGLIRQLFPAAPVIHIQRDAMETGFSIYRRNFTKQWPFTNDQKDIADYYRSHVDMMTHWKRAYPQKTAYVQYEGLVRSFETEMRRLIEYSGLVWDERCLKYYEQDRSVITFSATQVRKPPSPEHLNSTAAYTELLNPLRQALVQNGIG